MSAATAAIWILAFQVIALGWAQTVEPGPADTLQEIGRLRAEIRAQQQRLDDLEKRISTAPPVEVEPVFVSPSPPEAPSAAPEAPRPIDISGYFDSSYVRLPGGSEPSSYQQQTLSLFFGKTFGNWRFHSELEYIFGPEVGPANRHSGDPSGSLGLETAWLDYRYRDGLNVKFGILLTPTYWSTHHYPSTTLTVLSPLLHQRIFPAVVIGTMVHGTRYFERERFDYQIYGGTKEGFDGTQENENYVDGGEALGGKVVAHLRPSRFFETTDLGVHLYSDRKGGGHQNIYGFETRIERERFELLGEFAHSDVWIANGSRCFFREGYYLQPGLQIAKGTHLYYRYDRLNSDSRSPAGTLARHTSGINFRPQPSVSLKLEWNSNAEGEAQRVRSNGLAAAVSFFFQ